MALAPGARPLATLIFAILLTGCDQPTGQAPAQQKLTLPGSSTPRTSAADFDAFRSYLGLTAYTSLSNAAQQAQQFDQRLSAFLHQPDATHLVQAQSAWRQAYDAYLNSLIYAYLPINDPIEWRQKGIGYQATLALLDSWPIEGGYIDHVPGYPYSGIVNDLTLELSESNLLEQHGFSDPSYASLGYHALEFMLWGANGDRDASDFIARENTAPVVIASEGSAAEPDNNQNNQAAAVSSQVQNHNRRRHYLQLLSNQLLEHLHRLLRRWEPSNGYYAGLLEKTPGNQAMLATMMASQSLLSKELLDRRMASNSSEFSNTGMDDIVAIINGLKLLLSGQEHGQGIMAIIADTQLTQDWQQQFAVLDQNISDWQEQGMANAELNQKVRLQLIQLLSLLEKTAESFDLRLPRSDELSSR